MAQIACWLQVTCAPHALGRSGSGFGHTRAREEVREEGCASSCDHGFFRGATRSGHPCHCGVWRGPIVSSLSARHRTSERLRGALLQFGTHVKGTRSRSGTARLRVSGDGYGFRQEKPMRERVLAQGKPNAGDDGRFRPELRFGHTSKPLKVHWFGASESNCGGRAGQRRPGGEDSAGNGEVLRNREDPEGMRTPRVLPGETQAGMDAARERR